MEGMDRPERQGAERNRMKSQKKPTRARSYEVQAGGSDQNAASQEKTWWFLVAKLTRSQQFTFQPTASWVALARA